MIIMRIAILENETEYVSQMKNMIMEWKADKNINCEIKIDHFFTAEDFLESEIETYQMAFLDIQLDGKINGIQAAQQLRGDGIALPIVFLTSYSQYVFTGYEVRALNYLVKPIECKRVYWCLDRVYEMEYQGDYLFKEKDKMCKISFKKILFFQSSLHYIEIYVIGKSYRQKKSFKDLIKLLPPQFVQCHRTIVVNVTKIDYINGKELRLTDGSVLPISNTYLEKVRKTFMTLTMEEK